MDFQSHNHLILVSELAGFDETRQWIHSPVIIVPVKVKNIRSCMDAAGGGQPSVRPKIAVGTDGSPSPAQIAFHRRSLSELSFLLQRKHLLLLLQRYYCKSSVYEQDTVCSDGDTTEVELLFVMLFVFLLVLSYV